MNEQLATKVKEQHSSKWIEWIPLVTCGSLMIYQIVLAIIQYKSAPSVAIQWLGWVLLWSTFILGQLPIWILRKYGNVKKGKSYIHTTTVVDKGLYSLMRHPQYFSWILITFGLSCLNQLWYSFLISILIAPIFYYGMIREERSLIKKFGEEYQSYMKEVPRINFLLGIYRRIQNYGRSS